MKKLTLATTVVISLLTAASVQAQTGGKGGMHLPKETKDTIAHHKYEGSSLHEAAASAHSLAAKHHKKAAAMYRKNADSNAVEHAETAISSSNDAMAATDATKDILPK